MAKLITLETDGSKGTLDSSTLGVGSFVPYTGATTDVDLGEYQIKVGQLEFDQTPTGTFGVGKVRWNDQDGTTERRLKGNNVTLQDGQEVLKRVVNKTGVNLLESEYKVVRLRNVAEGGSQGQRSAAVLAQANTNLNSKALIGVVTENISNNQEGFITLIGEVRGINTTGSLQGETWVDGDQLYLSATVAGQLTNLVPVSPNYSIPIATIDYAHITQGKISVHTEAKLALDITLSDDNDTAPSVTAVKTYIDQAISMVSGTSLTEVEIDFGTNPLNNKTFTITDVTVISTNKIIVTPSPNDATGQVGNDWEVDGATFSAKANTGNMTLYVNAPFSMNGKRKIYYQILN